MPFFTPDYIFSSYRDVTPDNLRNAGVTALILDVDNTLIPYEESLPTEEIVSYFQNMKENGILLALVTNNRKKRLFRFSEKLTVPAFANSAKPFPHNLRKAMHTLGVSPENTAMLGDQIFTDVIAARLAGLRAAYIVPPIRDKRDPLTKLKRLGERPFIKQYYKNHKEN